MGQHPYYSSEGFLVGHRRQPTSGKKGSGYNFLHLPIDHAVRLALCRGPARRAALSSTGPLVRALQGAEERVMTDNGSDMPS